MAVLPPSGGRNTLLTTRRQEKQGKLFDLKQNIFNDYSKNHDLSLEGNYYTECAAMQRMLVALQLEIIKTD